MTSKLVCSVTLDTTSFADGIRKAAQQLMEIVNQHERQNWWKRSDGPPGYTAEMNDREWWQKGDDSPEHGTAA